LRHDANMTGTRKANSLACPRCGLASNVTETRSAEYGLRRRRQCSDLTCLHRFTTAEMIVDVSSRPSKMLIVDEADIEMIGHLADRMRRQT
jgi:transcriptional regulator NrdR family protein